MDSRDGHKQIALQLIAEVAGADVTTLKPETELVADLGIDSPKALYLLVELEERLEVEVSDEEVEEMKTVGDILDAVERYRSMVG
ncbi:MAG: phosphopantetheine-binding protein [Thermoanaerobaculia bacterium]